MSQDTSDQRPATRPTEAQSLKERMRQQQQQPGSPPSAPAQPAASPTGQSTFQQTGETRTSTQQTTIATKSAIRASHFTDDEGVSWTRTGLTLPTAYWKGIVAYVDQAKLQWEPGQEKITQQQLIVEAIGIWLNDHRAGLPSQVNAVCDQVRETLRSLPR